MDCSAVLRRYTPTCTHAHSHALTQSVLCMNSMQRDVPNVSADHDWGLVLRQCSWMDKETLHHSPTPKICFPLLQGGTDKAGLCLFAKANRSQVSN